MKPDSKSAYRLMHEGTLIHAEIEAAGIRIDTPCLDRTIKRTGKKIEQLTDELKQDEVWKVWKRRFGSQANMGSRPQLGKVLFDELGLTSSGKTKKRKQPSVDEKSLARLDLPFVKRFLQVEKLKKLKSTYLMGIRREVVDGFLRPSFNLHLARTYRPSSDSPNFQNIPIRDKRVGKMIRSCFIPRDGHVLVEVDYSALEWKIAACFWRDKKMVEYASDPTKDIHRDMAAECYRLSIGQVTGGTRFCTKSGFVFPVLYGSYYVNCAHNMWEMVDTDKLKTVGGVGLREHLAKKGISKMGYCQSSEKPEEGTFEKHIQQVEQRFNQRFPEWNKRKEQWWEQYLKEGRFRTMTGFVCTGIYSKNDLMNYPIQGPAFHCLLQSLIWLVRKMQKKKMRSMVVGQIFDSIFADVHRDELDDYLAMAKQIMTEDIRREWKWIIVPLSIEAEVAETNWYEKEAVEL